VRSRLPAPSGLLKELQRDVIGVAEAEDGTAERILAEIRAHSGRGERVRKLAEVGSAGAGGHVIQADPVLAEPALRDGSGRRAQDQD
jgi:hypothetical protein